MVASVPVPARLHSARAVPNAPLDPGAVLGGRYRIESCIGEGGMGYVLRARHLELDTLVAIKVVRPEFASNPEASARLLEESRSMASVHSEYIVGVHDAGRLPDGSLYLVLELVDGPDLERVISAQGSLSSADTIAFALDACVGLGVAHARGIIHRDIKPENLLLSTDAQGAHRVKISDFGIAKRTTHVRTRALTLPTMALGSPCYMAPEQMRNASDIDGRADVWSLGVVLYEMCTGTVPFSGATPLEICTMVMTTSPRAPSEVRLGVAPDLERIIARCLEREPAARYQTVGELAHELSLVVAPAGAESRRLVTGLRPYDESPATTFDASADESRLGARDAAHERMFETRITLVTDRKKTVDAARAASRSLALPVDTLGAPPSRSQRRVAGFGMMGAAAILGLAVLEPAAVARLFVAATSTLAATWRHDVTPRPPPRVGGHVSTAPASMPASMPVSMPASMPASIPASMRVAPVATAPGSTFDFEADARGVADAPTWTMPLEPAGIVTTPVARTGYARVPSAGSRLRASDAYEPEVVTGNAPPLAEPSPPEAAVTSPESVVEVAPVEAPSAPSIVTP